MFVNKSLVTPERQDKITFIPLSESELPLTGRIVGLDAEFVKLNKVSVMMSSQYNLETCVACTDKITFVCF